VYVKHEIDPEAVEKLKLWVKALEADRRARGIPEEGLPVPGEHRSIIPKSDDELDVR
jgi:hypothetical protein